MKKMLACLLAAMLLPGLAAGARAENAGLGLTTDVKPATEFTARINAAVYNELDFDDRQEAEFAQRNLIDAPEKLELVDEAYQKLLTDEARELLDSAGCAEVEITWGSEPVEPVEAIMRSAGLRDADSGDDAAWDVAGLEKSLLENYGVTPHHYEDLGDGVYQVYVEIDGEIVPFVAVDSATGDYHG